MTFTYIVSFLENYMIICHYFQTLVLSYAYHCCEFMPLMEGGSSSAGSADSAESGDEEPEQFSDLVLLPPAHVDLAAWANATDIWPHYRNQLAISINLHLLWSDFSTMNVIKIIILYYTKVNATGESSSRLAAVGWGDVSAAELKYGGNRRVRCLPLPGMIL